MLDVFSDPHGDVQGLFGLFAEFAVKFHQEQSFPERRCLVLWSFLEAIWRNPSAHNFLLNMRKFSSRYFGVNVIGEAEFNGCFDQWFTNRERSIL